MFVVLVELFFSGGDMMVLFVYYVFVGLVGFGVEGFVGFVYFFSLG